MQAFRRTSVFASGYRANKMKRKNRMATDAKTRRHSQSGDVLTLAAERAQRYVRAASHRKVAPSKAALAALAELNEPFPSSPSDPSKVIARLDELGSPATVTTTGGRYFGFVNGGMAPAALAANWLAAAWNQNAALRVMSPVAAELEEVVLRWVCEALGLPADCAGGWSPAPRWRISPRSRPRVTHSLRARGGTS